MTDFSADMPDPGTCTWEKFDGMKQGCSNKNSDGNFASMFSNVVSTVILGGLF